MRKEFKIGTFRKNQKGFGFVKIEELEDETFKNYIVINP